MHRCINIMECIKERLDCIVIVNYTQRLCNGSYSPSESVDPILASCQHNVPAPDTPNSVFLCTSKSNDITIFVYVAMKIHVLVITKVYY